MVKSNFLRFLFYLSFPVCVFLFNVFLILAFDIYQNFPEADIPMHFLGGASIAYSCVLFFDFFKAKKWIKLDNKIIFIVLVVSMVSVVAVFWEFSEFIYSKLPVGHFFNIYMELELEDTLLDLFMGICGGFLVPFLILIFEGNFD